MQQKEYQHSKPLQVINVVVLAQWICVTMLPAALRLL
jgi:hypothetical protein